MKYLRIPIVDIEDGINNEMMIASDAVLHAYEPISDTLTHLLTKSNEQTESPLKLLLKNSFTVSNEKSIEVETTSKDSLVFVKVDYAIDVTNGKPIQLYHTISHDMGGKNKATIFLKSEKTTLCSISVYEVKI